MTDGAPRILIHNLRRGDRRTIVWTAVLLLSCYLGGRLNAGEGANPKPPAQPDPFRTEELTIPAGDHELAGTLYLPLAEPPAPAVVFGSTAVSLWTRSG